MARRHRIGCAPGRDGAAENKLNIRKISILILVINAVSAESGRNETDEDVRGILNDTPKRMEVIQSVSGRGNFGDVYQNGTFRTGNILWDNILNKCTVRPSVSCLQKNLFSYLDESLDFNGDVDVASGVRFERNDVDLSKYSKEANRLFAGEAPGGDGGARAPPDEDNEIADEDEPETPLEEVTDALYSKGVKFLMTHDVSLSLPEALFGGATLRVSPRALTPTGALVHLDLEPREERGQGRIFFHKIKKYIKKKLVMAALAIVLVVKLIALKLVFVLPVVLGVTTAKKMFLKVLLFLFPALSHIFKLCSWYHQNYHTTKYHHHHHLITHHHKAPHHHAYGAPPRPHADGPAALDHYPQDWELSGPGLGTEYLSDIHRNAVANFRPHESDGDHIDAWGLAAPPGLSPNAGEYAGDDFPGPGAGPDAEQPGRPAGPPSAYRRGEKTTAPDPEREALVRAAALAARAPPSAARAELLRVAAAKLREGERARAETELVRRQQLRDPATRRADAFYAALVARVERVLAAVGAGADAAGASCRHRAACALYAAPARHAPHSNLLSRELSLSAAELLPPAGSEAALRYFRYVQAARDGQDSADCRALYPDCDRDFAP